MANEVDFSHAVKGELYMEDFAFLLIGAEYGLNRNADERGAPTDAPKRSMVKVKIRIRGNQENYVRLLYEWALNSDKKMDGFMVFGELDEGTAEVRRVHFEGATCVGFRECFQNEQLNLLREVPMVYVPDSANYQPQYRGGEFFTNSMVVSAYDLVISADNLFIEGAEVPS
ncbi:type VI secretion system tube protein TssD [Persicitalea jodogahamensis]|uniref:Uncharacterized protein n=1 Tax=Persicitalea jodogahamensis TaxID=402147 RepID=A0A8J3D4P6_9BACT|nr:type VI secretion system tube protein TssD [Persicitalea jodogahamensis]GHB52113.1 hypothetical protein GCM10007390_00920 [Persicitalea jodogahamensis]